MHQAKKNACQQNARKNTKRFGEQRIEIAAKDSFFDQRRHQHSHAEQENGAVAVAENLLDRRVIVGVHLKCGDRDKNGQQASGEKINPGTACGRYRVLQLFPAERSPEREPAQHRERDIEKQKNQGVPEHIATEKKLRLVEEVLLELLLRQGLMRGVIKG